MFTLLRILGNSAAFAIYFAAFIVLLMLGLFLITPWGWSLVPAALVTYIGIKQQARKRRGNAVVEYMDQAVRLNLPLPDAIAAAAASESGATKLTLTKLAGELFDGVPPGEAMRRTVRELPAQQRSVILAGEQTGRLAPALRRVARTRRAALNAESPMLGTVWGYPVAMATIICAVLLLLMVLIVPKFEAIFEDFNAELPGVTLSIIHVSKWLGGRLYAGQLVPGILWIALVVLIGTAVGLAAQVGGFGSLPARVLWFAPVLGRVQRARAWSDACFVVGQSLEAGAPLDDALGEAAKLRVNPIAARRLHKWARLVRAGQPLHEATAHARLPDLMTGTLATAQASNNLPAALAFLGKHYELQESWAAALVRGAAVPAIVVGFAVVVAWITLGLLMPLVTLIWSLIPAAQGVDL